MNTDTSQPAAALRNRDRRPRSNAPLHRSRPQMRWSSRRRNIGVDYGLADFQGNAGFRTACPVLGADGTS